MSTDTKFNTRTYIVDRYIILNGIQYLIDNMRIVEHDIIYDIELKLYCIRDIEVIRSIEIYLTLNKNKIDFDKLFLESIRYFTLLKDEEIEDVISFYDDDTKSVLDLTSRLFKHFNEKYTIKDIEKAISYVMAYKDILDEGGEHMLNGFDFSDMDKEDILDILVNQILMYDQSKHCEYIYGNIDNYIEKYYKIDIDDLSMYDNSNGTYYDTIDFTSVSNKDIFKYIVNTTKFDRIFYRKYIFINKYKTISNNVRVIARIFKRSDIYKSCLDDIRDDIICKLKENMKGDKDVIDKFISTLSDYIDNNLSHGIEVSFHITTDNKLCELPKHILDLSSDIEFITNEIYYTDLYLNIYSFRDYLL